MRRVLMAVVAVSLAGCGWVGGAIRDASTASNFQYVMRVSSVRYVRTVTGSSMAVSIFCAIPVDVEPYGTAMARLMEEANLKINQTVTNLREDHAIRSYLGFACVHYVTVSGDVVEVTPESTSAQQAPL